MKPPKPTESIDKLMALVKAAAAEAANYQDRFAAEDTEARRIVDIMEDFLRAQGRVVYGGAAINAHLPPDKKFYDPTLYLPDYDFMTPDPLQDCADLIVTFKHNGFSDVEAKFGIHEGTYKVFVNFRPAADITFMPRTIYSRIVRDSKRIDGIRYASVNYLRMNMYLELSRPAGMVSRWEKVYERLLLLNDAHPLKVRGCKPVGEQPMVLANKKQLEIQDRIVHIGIEAGAVFLSGIPDVQREVILMMSDTAPSVVAKIKEAFPSSRIKVTQFDALGELLPARTEITKQTPTGPSVIAVVFETVACHSYTVLPLPYPEGYRFGSLDLLIQMYYAMYFAGLHEYVLPVRLMCRIQSLIDLEVERRSAVAGGEGGKGGEGIRDVFPLDCIGHQPTMPELKRAHRQRVQEKQEALHKAIGVVAVKT